jgi:CubicO group peptidase (beta-lactamase class C family)
MRNAIMLTGLLVAIPQAAQTPDAWQQYAQPAEAGFSDEQLRTAHAFADSVGSAAVMAVYRGRVLLAWGDVARKMPTHSVRKSLVSALYGIAVDRNQVRLDATLAQLGIDDHAGLTPLEKTATVRDLISARSGVYLPAAYASADQDSARPARSSHRPGAHWFYSNWDFNVAGVVYELATNSNLYEAFEHLIARPIGMQDYTPADAFLVVEPTLSRYPAHTFAMSARDMARLGLLYLQNGRWNDRQVIPASWIRESTRAHSDLGKGTGYGYMWWTYAAGSLAPHYPHLSRHDLYMARGTGGQAIFVVPGADLVVVHRGDTENARPVAGARAWQIVERILAAREGEPARQPATVALTPTPFTSQLRAAILPNFITVEPAALARLIGNYEMASGAVLRVFLFDGRPFINVPGLGEAELFGLSPLEFTIRVQAGVGIRFETDASGTVTGVILRLGSQEMRARRR